LIFYEDYTEIKNNKQDDIKKILDKLNDKYFNQNSILEINLDFHKKNEFYNFYKNYKIFKFDDLIPLMDSLFEGVLTNIMDTFSRFVYSKEYIKVLKSFSNYITNIDIQ
jgi:hypothetical protein